MNYQNAGKIVVCLGHIWISRRRSYAIVSCDKNADPSTVPKNEGIFPPVPMEKGTPGSHGNPTDDSDVRKLAECLKGPCEQWV